MCACRGGSRARRRGSTTGSAAISNAQRAGYQGAGLSLALDMEGVGTGDANAHAEAWCEVVSQNGYAPVVYVGFDSQLTGQQLDALTGSPAFWCDYAPFSARPAPARGYSLHQHAQSVLAGVGVDENTVIHDGAIVGLSGGPADVRHGPGAARPPHGPERHGRLDFRRANRSPQTGGTVDPHVARVERVATSGPGTPSVSAQSGPSSCHQPFTDATPATHPPARCLRWTLAPRLGMALHHLPHHGRLQGRRSAHQRRVRRRIVDLPRPHRAPTVARGQPRVSATPRGILGHEPSTTHGANADSRTAVAASRRQPRLPWHTPAMASAQGSSSAAGRGVWGGGGTRAGRRSAWGAP